MGRPSKPYFWTEKDGWYATIKGTRFRLAKGRDGREEAQAAFHRLMAAQGGPPRARPGLTTAELCDLFLGHLEAHGTRPTFRQYLSKLRSFCRLHGGKRAMDLRAAHLRAWAVGRGWADATAATGISCVKACWRWGLDEGLVDGEPFRGVKCPAGGRRERTLTAAEAAAIRGAATARWGEFLDALRWTGARFNEVARLEARHIDWGAAYAELPGKTTSATGLKIGLALVPPMLELCRRLAAEHPSGPIFRNEKGSPWSHETARRRMRAAGKAAGVEGVTPHVYRHTFITDALERGVPVTDVAALANHRSIQTTMRYAHLKQRRDHLRRQAERATGLTPPG